jgi:hypothetical protein
MFIYVPVLTLSSHSLTFFSDSLSPFLVWISLSFCLFLFPFMFVELDSIIEVSCYFQICDRDFSMVLIVTVA